MPSRVRIHFYEAGVHFYDSRATSELWRLHRAAVKNRYLLTPDLKTFPTVRWQLAVKLFEDAQRYMRDYTGDCWLKVIRERRGVKLRRFKKVKEKKSAQARRHPVRLAAVPRMQEARNAPVQMRGVAFNADQLFRWRVGDALGQEEPVQQQVQRPQRAPERPWGMNLDEIFRADI